MVENDYVGVAAICGQEGSGKSTFALDFPKPLVHFDIDVGGYRRAAWRLDTTGIESKSYPKQLQVDKLLGQKLVGSGASMSVRIPKKVEGTRELWQQIMTDYVAACQRPEVKSIVFDSATLLWIICHEAYLQEQQEKQIAHGISPEHEKFRERLTQIEYGTSNERMRMVLQTSRVFSKNLILTHYPTAVYAQKVNSRGEIESYNTGELKMDGFGETSKVADLIIWVSTREQTIQLDPKIPPKRVIITVGKVTKCGIVGIPRDIVGTDIPATFADIMRLRVGG
jgi:hypothetical protein